MQDTQHRPEPREIELKLEIDPGDVEQFRNHPFFRSGTNPKQLRAVYFDTSRFALRDSGISFRVRESGGKRVQTIKAEGPRSGVTLDRGEWERDRLGGPGLQQDRRHSARAIRPGWRRS